MEGETIKKSLAVKVLLSSSRPHHKYVANFAFLLLLLVLVVRTNDALWLMKADPSVGATFQRIGDRRSRNNSTMWNYDKDGYIKDNNRGNRSQAVKLAKASNVLYWSRQDVLKFLKHYWYENTLCSWYNQHSSIPQQQHLNIQLGSCKDFLSHCENQLRMSTGNILTAYYGIRFTCQQFGINLTIACDIENNNELQEQILPWIMGNFPAPAIQNPNLILHNNKTSSTSFHHRNCSSEWTFHKTPIKKIVGSIQKDMRRMAISVVQKPTETEEQIDHADYNYFDPQEQEAYQYTVDRAVSAPRKLQLNDVTIHFRGGDLLRQPHRAYGFLSFGVYKELILNASHLPVSLFPQSIGIVTSTFGTGQKNDTSLTSRKSDVEASDKHQFIVKELAKYLHEQFPSTKVHIHSEEATVISYARLILSRQQTIGAFSSFVAFPAISTLGQGYLLQNSGSHYSSAYEWLAPQAQEVASNDTYSWKVRFFAAPDHVLKSAAINYVWEHLGWEVLLRWFRGEINILQLKQMVLEYEESGEEEVDPASMNP